MRIGRRRVTVMMTHVTVHPTSLNVDIGQCHCSTIIGDSLGQWTGVPAPSCASPCNSPVTAAPLLQSLLQSTLKCSPAGMTANHSSVVKK